MKITKVTSNGNKSCKCGYIFMPKQTAYCLPKRDSLSRPVFICDKCKDK